MSYDPPAPPQRERPATVTIASWLLILVGAIYALSFVVAVALIGTWNDIYQEVLAGTEAEGTEAAITAITVATAGVSLLLGIGLVVLAILNNKGKNPARIVTWVLGGITLCCMGVNMLLSGMSVQTGDEVDQAQLEQLMTEQLPGWYNSLETATTIISLPALLVALILLALPASNEFFRKPEQPFEPPPGYPPVG